MTPTQALIEAAETVVNDWRQEYHGLSLLRAVHKLEAAILSAKAAEEGAETKWRMDSLVDGVYEPFTCELDDLTHAESWVTRPSDRLVMIEKRETVIEVREKEGL